MKANAFKTNAAGKAAPNKKYAPTDACFQEASAALRRERRPGRRGREAATRTAAPGTAHPDGPSGRRERRRNSGGCRAPGLLRGWRKPLNPTACTDRLKLPTAWRAEPAQCKTVDPPARRAEHTQSKTLDPPPGRQATGLKDFAALRANAFKTNAAGKATPNKKHAPTDACFQEASAALRRERRPGRRGREAATRTAAPGTAHPDGPSGRRERRRNSGGCRTPGLLRGWRKPLNPTACTDRLKLPAAWRAEPAQCKTVDPPARRAEHTQSKTLDPPPGRQATGLKDFAALRANAFKTNAAGKATPNKKHAPTDAGFPEASAALRRERRPGRRGREAATRTAAPGMAHPDGPSGRSKRRRNSGGCRTPGLLRGWREPLNPTACTGRLKLRAAWRAEHAQNKTITPSRAEHTQCKTVAPSRAEPEQNPSPPTAELPYMPSNSCRSSCGSTSVTCNPTSRTPRPARRSSQVLRATAIMSSLFSTGQTCS